MKKGFTEHLIIFDSPVKRDASAWITHTPFGFFLVSILRPKLFVELGVHTGHSYNAFCQAVRTLKTGTCCYGIDTWKGDEHAGFYGEDVYQQLLEYQLKEYPEFSHLLRMTFDEGLAYFSNQGIDLLHIDGLHTYEAVKHDFEEWLPKMSDKGVVLLHDTMLREPDFGVWRLWNEIAPQYPSLHFTHGYGLGIVAVGSNVCKEFLDFLNEANTNLFYHKLFFSLGKLCSLDAFVEERDTRIKSLEETIREKGAEVDAVRADLAERDAAVTERDAQIGAFDHSTSLRITWPLRIVGHQLKKIRRMGLRRRIACLFGMMYWQDGEQKISQGFTEEELQMPGENVDNPLISVVMPVYNACRNDKKHLLTALESIANQSYKNVELIIVDDGSTDDSRQVCDDFLSTRSDLRARYFSKKNGGQSSARNFGVKNCSGEYIAFIDQDDEWYNDKLEQVVPWLGDRSIDVLYTDADTIDNDGNIIHRRIHQSLFAGWPHPKKAVEDILFKDIFVMPGLMTIKKETFEKVGGFDENLSGYEDDDLFLRLFEKSRIFYLPVPTLRWRMYSNNYSFSYRMLASRSYYWRKLLKNYTDNGANQIRVRMISLRFFRQFISQALYQYDAGNELYGRNIDGAREIVLHLPKPQRFLFGFVFLLPLKYTMLTLVLARKALNIFR